FSSRCGRRHSYKCEPTNYWNDDQRLVHLSPCPFPRYLRVFRAGGRNEHYSSNFKLAALTTSANTLMSASIFFRNSSPGPPPGLTAMALSFSRTPGSASARRASLPSLLAIAGGVPATTNIPLKRPIFPSGWPVPPILGTSGSSEERSDPVTASARILPPCTSGMVGGPSAMANNVVPPATLSIISLLLL